MCSIKIKRLCGAGERRSWRPPTAESFINNPPFNRKVLTQRRYTPCHSHDGESAIRPGISCLLPAGCPSAIFRAVTFLVIFALKRFSVRPLAHIFQKATERVPPGIDRDPASSIASPSCRFWISATPQHTFPAPVSGAPNTVEQMAVLEIRRMFEVDLINISDEGFCRHGIGLSMLCSAVGVRRQPALTAILVTRPPKSNE